MNDTRFELLVGTCCMSRLVLCIRTFMILLLGVTYHLNNLGLPALWDMIVQGRYSFEADTRASSGPKCRDQLPYVSNSATRGHSKSLFQFRRPRRGLLDDKRSPICNFERYVFVSRSSKRRTHNFENPTASSQVFSSSVASG